MDNKIIDGIKKEGKSFLRLAIFVTILFALTFIYMYVNILIYFFFWFFDFFPF